MSEKKNKKKYKIKNKPLLILIFFILSILIGIVLFIGYKLYSEDTLKTIKKNYNEYVLTTRKTNIYNKDNTKIGTISGNFYLELEKVNDLSLKNKHLKIKDTSYYISYRDIEKTTKKEKNIETVNSYYLDLDKSIETSKKIDLLDKNNKSIITINEGLNIKINSIDDNYYYINFLNNTFKIKKDKTIKEIEGNGKSPDNSYVSVIHYDNISDNCSGDNTCLNTNSVMAHIEKLKSNGYYFITKEDYIRYLKGYVNLKEKAILLTTNSLNEYTNKLKVNIFKIEDKDNLIFKTTNKKSTRNDNLKELNRYQAKKYTIIDDYLKMAEGKDYIDDGGSNNAINIPVVNYHFFYDSTKDECNESICLEAKKFEEQLKWLQDNNYKTLTIKEFADWKDGIIELPEHSVLLTVDDGAKGTGKHNGNVLIPMLEKYKEHATLFLITGWWDLGNYKSDYLDVQSHTHNLHFEAQCADGRGRVVCSDYKTVKADLEQSIKVLGDTTSFCFPFYSYDKESLQAIKELGFRVAFVGGNIRTNRSQNNHLITRYPILSDITLNQFISIVK